MTKVAVKGNLENALKKFKQQVSRNGTLTQYKKKEHFDKPGVVRREAIKNAKKNAAKNARKRDY